METKASFPSVSVVTITYGHDEYIEDCLKGVLSQRYNGEIEFIISNDHSPDNTDQIIRDFLKSTVIPENIKIKYLHHTVNRGSSFNFISTLAQAQGEYVALCDGDDFWIDPCKLQKQIDFLEKNPDYKLIFTNVDTIYEDDLENKVSILTPIVENRQYLGEEFLRTWIAHTSTFVYRNDDHAKAYGQFYNAHNFLYGDTPLLIYILQSGKAFGLTDYTSCYRRHIGGAISKSSVQNTLRYIEYLNSFNRAFNKPIYTKIHHHLISVSYFGLFRNNNIKGTNRLEYLFKCIYYDPFLIFKIIREKLSNFLKRIQ
ncbi:glycosyltransferase [Elizabethkingia argentiflava]|uniref:Glycosyltransferase n=1 Tax=Elizabethkingia argenteiflava TaxID=2681556 RepID=A0A845PZ16_9FLAO|nr:glycosyltransferase family 2 protein [Elizabethkingia argenteiflava]NAW51330.1 glycosyltransferase [Elizabethkingia argenteiflava]